MTTNRGGAGHRLGYVLIDARGRWWKGFYRGWRDGAEGRGPSVEPVVRDRVCPAGYDAGWTEGRLDSFTPDVQPGRGSWN
jgi:hypothetical protein